MMQHASSIPFLEKFPPRVPRRVTLRDVDGNVDPAFGWGASSHGPDKETRRIREAAAKAVQNGYLANDPRTRRMVWLLRRMCYDDALVCGEWRVELLYLNKGQPHFRLYYRGYTFGIVSIATSHADLGAARTLEAQRHLLAAYLVGWGLQSHAVALVEFGALTRYNANSDHQYRLFDVGAKRRVEHVYDIFREQEAG
jgi:hypothetical protein